MSARGCEVLLALSLLSAWPSPTSLCVRGFLIGPGPTPARKPRESGRSAAAVPGSATVREAWFPATRKGPSDHRSSWMAASGGSPSPIYSMIGRRHANTRKRHRPEGRGQETRSLATSFAGKSTTGFDGVLLSTSPYADRSRSRVRLAANGNIDEAGAEGNSGSSSSSRSRSRTDSGGMGLDLDPESIAQAREAAKKDDFDWFMEFIGSEQDDDGDASGGSGSGNNSRAGRNKPQIQRRSGRGAQLHDHARDRYYDDERGMDNRQQAMRSGGDGRRRRAGMDPEPPRRKGPSRQEQEFEPRGGGSGGSGGGGGGNRRAGGYKSNVPANTAYDYDLDEEFDGEPGRGGWGYDPGYTSAVRARRKGVDIGEVRARAQSRARRLPLADEVENEWKGVPAGQGQAVGGGEGVVFEPVGPEKANILSAELGYTDEEIACIDPDMADLAIERKLRRPASGMLADWVGVGATPPPTQPAARERKTGETIQPSPVGSSTGPLDLDEILYGGGREGGDGDAGGRGRGERRRRDTGGSPSGPGARRDRGDSRRDDGYRGDYEDESYFPNGRSRDQEQPRRRMARDERGRQSPYYYESENDDFSSNPGRSSNNGRKRSSKNGDDYYEDDDYARRGNGDSWDDDRRGYGYGDDPEFESRWRDDDGRGGRRGRGSGRAKARPAKRKLNAAEKYEQMMFGRDDDDDVDGKIWTGVGPDGPWPTLEEFTKLLREETEVRLSLVGPWAAEIVAVENKFRLDLISVPCYESANHVASHRLPEAYKKWLEILDKGIGETLEEAGVFDAAFPQDDDSSDNLYDNYTSYGDSRNSRRGVYDDRGRGVGRSSRDDYDGRFERPGRPDSGEAPRRENSRRRDWDGDIEGPESRGTFDVGSFLRSVPENLIQPAPGMEEAAARFERNYPGRQKVDLEGRGVGEEPEERSVRRQRPTKWEEEEDLEERRRTWE